MNRLTDVGAEDHEVKLYCAASARSAGFSLLAGAWTHGDGVNPYMGLPVRGGAPVRSAGFSPSACNPQSAIPNPQWEESSIPNPQSGESAIRNPQSEESAIRNPQSGESAIPNPQSEESAIRNPQSEESSIRNPQSAIRNPQSAIEECRGGAQVRSAGFSLSPSEECRGGADWLDERATEALLHRAGVLCYNPQYPVYEKQTFAYDGWRVIQEHKKTDGNGIPVGTAIPVARQFTYGNYLDEALTVDADTDSDGDCIDSGGSTRYYYHQNSLFSVVALSDASANYKEGYQYDPYGRHVRITDGNDGDTYVNFNTNDVRSALATSAYGNPYLFTGQRFDSESGLYYYKNRYYSTSQGRFISRDPIGYGDSNNLYEYATSDPIEHADSLGLGNDYKDLMRLAQETIEVCGGSIVPGGSHVKVLTLNGQLLTEIPRHTKIRIKKRIMHKLLTAIKVAGKVGNCTCWVFTFWAIAATANAGEPDWPFPEPPQNTSDVCLAYCDSFYSDREGPSLRTRYRGDRWLWCYKRCRTGKDPDASE